jgi:hypothetical protein
LPAFAEEASAIAGNKMDYGGALDNLRDEVEG